MARVDATGISPTDLSGYIELLQERFRDEFGSDLALDPETPAGQFISISALMLTEADESLVDLANALSLSSSRGKQLDDLGTLLHVNRRQALRTRVQGTLTGQAGTLVRAGSRAKKDDGTEFETLSDATIAANGMVNVEFVAVDSGPIRAPAGTINQIVTLISGWETVNNAADATQIGESQESDFSFRRRYDRLTGQNSVSTFDALRAALFNAGARRVRIEENETAAPVTRQGLTIAAQGVMAIVLGGAVDSIAEAVLDNKPLGAAMSGNTPHSDGPAAGRFQTVTETPLRVVIELTVLPGTAFPGDGVNRIRAALVSYANGTFEAGEQQFETDGFQIGEIIDLNRLRVPLYSVPGHSIDTFTVRVRGSGDTTTDTALPATPNLDVLYTLTGEDVEISVTTT